jgi:nucleoside-diphosphate-sugar epimerase
VNCFLILGAGFTGSRVAAQLLALGHDVRCIRRVQLDVTSTNATQTLASLTPPDSIVLHSIPSLDNGADASILQGLVGRARRVVYLSTTGVYGAVQEVNEHTPREASDQPRILTEQALEAGPWQSLILRPAAIYGPGRGVHVAMAAGRYTLMGDGSNYISRIHVDDLASIATAGLLSTLSGAWPVADEHPSTSKEIADYCSALLQVPPAVSAPLGEVPVSRRGNRRVNGRAICRALGVTLRYPSYREGIPASLTQRGML